ncbi:hypothetical protein ACH5RR_024589 [Cinchona calisaya]|uniref:Uncharacterized protein n=1 Tax=Cinchona calisaya TaxID=153742 RepID=A0ABD2YX53_9GENT
MKSSSTPLYHQMPKAVEEADKREENTSLNGNTTTTTSRPGHHAPLKKAAEPNTTKRLLEGKPTEDINASAEAFINKFRQHLLLQRLESIENYDQMLKRGT